MLRTRIITAAILIPVAVYVVYLGELPLLVLMGLLLTLAEIEFCSLMARDGFRPTLVFGLGMMWLFLLDVQFPAWQLLRPGLALVLLGSAAWQLLHRQGSAVADWALTVTGGLYLGMCGAALIGLRGLNDDGLWWTLTAVFSIMCADSAAYFVGRAVGQHKLAPTLSPGKTWEGYVAGVLIGAPVTALLTLLWRTWASGGTAIGPLHGLILGLLIATLAPLGDLAVSMIKRQVGVKDSGTIVPGHGGALDRVDSILWAAVIGYYYVLWRAG